MDWLTHASFLKVPPKPHLAPLYIITFLTKQSSKSQTELLESRMMMQLRLTHLLLQDVAS